MKVISNQTLWWQVRGYIPEAEWSWQKKNHPCKESMLTCKIKENLRWFWPFKTCAWGDSKMVVFRVTCYSEPWKAKATATPHAVKSHESGSVSHSVVSDSFVTRLLCPWNSPGKNTGAGCHSLLLGIFLTQGLNPHLLHCRQTLHWLSHQRSPRSPELGVQELRSKVSLGTSLVV